jgi:hypothetical protein
MNSIKTTARIAGFLYLLQIPLGVFGIIYIPQMLFVEDNLAKTTANILANESMFRLSMVSAILCALMTVATAHYIHKVLQPVNKTYARLIVIFTLMVAPITMVNELNHAAILLLLTKPEIQQSFSVIQIQSMVSFFIDLHQYGMAIMNIFFGLWLLPMSYLIIKSYYIPKVIGYFLLITCIGYLIDFIVFFLFPDFKILFSDYTWLGEVMMVTWLLVKGVKLKEFERFSVEIQKNV